MKYWRIALTLVSVVAFALSFAALIRQQNEIVFYRTDAEKVRIELEKSRIVKNRFPKLEATEIIAGKRTTANAEQPSGRDKSHDAALIRFVQSQKRWSAEAP